MYISNAYKNSVIFLLLFLSPHIIYSVIPASSVAAYYLILPICYIVLAIHLFKFFNNDFFLKPFILSISFIVFGLFNMIVYSNLAVFNLMAPIVAFLGYLFIVKKKIDLKIFVHCFYVMYIFFYIVYFSVLPDLFDRPGFDEDAIVFDNSSSNTIPMALNITLYTYMLFNEMYGGNANKNIFYFSIINLGLIIIQQSRAGLLISFALLIMALYNYNKKIILKVGLSFLIVITLIFISYKEVILNYFDVIGNLNGFDALNEDIRGEAQRKFFSDLDGFRFLFGYPTDYIFAYGTYTDIKYTYNVFLDLWNKYGVIQLIIFFALIIFRFIHFRKFYFPLFYLIPFLLYAMVESIFFPNFWDCIIYLVLFLPAKKIILNYQNPLIKNELPTRNEII